MHYIVIGITFFGGKPVFASGRFPIGLMSLICFDIIRSVCSGLPSFICFDIMIWSTFDLLSTLLDFNSFYLSSCVCMIRVMASISKHACAPMSCWALLCTLLLQECALAESWHLMLWLSTAQPVSQESLLAAAGAATCSSLLGASPSTLAAAGTERQATSTASTPSPVQRPRATGNSGDVGSVRIGSHDRRASSETEIKFTLDLFTFVHNWRNSWQQVCTWNARFQKMFTHSVKSIKKSLHMRSQNIRKSVLVSY